MGNFEHFLCHEIFCDMPVRGHGCKKRWSSSPRAENVSVNRNPWHVTKNFMVQKVLEIIQIMTLRIEGL